MSILATEHAYKLKYLKAGPKFTLIALCDFLNGKTGQCNPCVKRIAEKTGYDHRTVRRHLRSLESAGLLETVAQKRSNGSSSSNSYIIKLDVPPCQNTTAPMTNKHQGHDNLPSSTHDKMTGEIHELETIEPESKTPVVPMHDFESEFDDFWSSWKPFDMSKGNKQTARKTFIKHRKKGVTNEEIRRGCERYIAYCHATGCKTKHVSTWLNQYGWEDEYPDPAAATPRNPSHQRSRNLSIDQIVEAARSAAV